MIVSHLRESIVCGLPVPDLFLLKSTEYLVQNTVYTWDGGLIFAKHPVTYTPFGQTHPSRL